jgi:hypothetical protein
VTFFDDAWQYVHLPKCTPILVSAAFLISIFLVLYIIGFSIGILFSIMFYFIWSKFSQSTIVSKLSRQSNGFAWGIITTLVGSYYLVLMDKLPFFLSYIVTVISSIICSTLYFSAIIHPITVTDITNQPIVAR